MYEIERKFLLDDLPPQLADLESTRVEQGYLAVTDDAEIRVRNRAGDHLLTVKKGRGEVRREVTVPLTAEQFDELWALTTGRRIEKDRWVVPYEDPQGELEVEIDRFVGDLAGLLVAEVEFTSEEASAAFQPPAWFGREVTSDDRYRNAALAVARPDD